MVTSALSVVIQAKTRSPWWAAAPSETTASPPRAAALAVSLRKWKRPWGTVPSKMIGKAMKTNAMP